MTDPVPCSSRGLFGLCIGSFLNVVIYRLPLGQSLVSPPSRCPKCGYSLRWYDNIPVFSWLLLGGRCRKCGEADLDSVSDRRAGHRAVVRAGGVADAGRSAAGQPADLRVHPDRAVRHRSRTSDPAELDHAAGHRGRVAVQLHRPAGLARRADRRRCSAPACCTRSPALLPVAARRRPRHGRRQDARDDRRVSRLEGRARDAGAVVVLRRRSSAWP